MDIGIQSNCWDMEYHREKLPQMLAEIAQAGYNPEALVDLWINARRHYAHLCQVNVVVIIQINSNLWKGVRDGVDARRCHEQR